MISIVFIHIYEGKTRWVRRLSCEFSYSNWSALPELKAACNFCGWGLTPRTVHCICDFIFSWNIFLQESIDNKSGRWLLLRQFMLMNLQYSQLFIYSHTTHVLWSFSCTGFFKYGSSKILFSHKQMKWSENPKISKNNHLFREFACFWRIEVYFCITIIAFLDFIVEMKNSFVINFSHSSHCMTIFLI